MVRELLSPEAEATYLALLAAGPDGEVLDEPQRRELVAAGLVTEHRGRRTGRYSAVTPAVAHMQASDAMRRIAAEVRARLSSTYEAVDRLQGAFVASRILGEADEGCQILPPGQVSSVVGALHAVVRNCLRAWNTGPYRQTQQSGSLLDLIVLPDAEVLQRGARILGAYDEAYLSLPGGAELIARSATSGEQVRLMDALPMKMVTLDERVAVLPLVANGMTALLIRDPRLVRMFIAFFDLVWVRGVPYGEHPTARAAGRRIAVKPYRDGLIPLMAAGLKDEAIARHLGVSARTVRRQIADICKRLGASNRFAAGVAAWKAGLIAGE